MDISVRVLGLNSWSVLVPQALEGVAAAALALGVALAPLLPAPRLSAAVGVEIWFKRDDLTGLLETGNKIRKLEYLLADAKGRGGANATASFRVEPAAGGSKSARAAATVRPRVIRSNAIATGRSSAASRSNVSARRTASSPISSTLSPARRAPSLARPPERVREQLLKVVQGA